MKYTKETKNVIWILVTILIILIIVTSKIHIDNKKRVYSNVVADKTGLEVEEFKNITKTDNYIDEENNILETQIETMYKGYEVIAKLEIPKIELETYVLSEYSVQALNVSVTKFYGGEPNEIGNFCISGHNFVAKNMFHDLKKLEIGDELLLTDLQNNQVKYVIYDIFNVDPDKTDCLSQKTNGRIEVTLITCTTDSSKRIIVKAVKQD